MDIQRPFQRESSAFASQVAERDVDKESQCGYQQYRQHGSIIMQRAETRQLTGAVIAGAEDLETVSHAAEPVLSAEAFLKRLKFL
jgi:hypothetical protein